MKKPLLIHRLNKSTSILEHIRWCRETLGVRGVDWDFTGGTSVDISIYTQPAATFYTLKFPSVETQ